MIIDISIFGLWSDVKFWLYSKLDKISTKINNSVGLEKKGSKSTEVSVCQTKLKTTYILLDC